MGTNKIIENENKREELYKQHSGKIINGVKYPYNKEVKGKERELNGTFLPKQLKKKYKEYKETKRNGDYDNLFDELIK